MEERRKSQRETVRQTAYVSHMGFSTRCMILNISTEGAAIEVADATCIPRTFKLMTANDRVVRNCRLVWIKLNTLGLEFENAGSIRPAIPASEAAPRLTHRHRQFMQYLQSGDWVLGAALPDRPKVIARLLQSGWVERKGEECSLAYRMTASGVAAKQSLLPIGRQGAGAR